MKFLYLAAIALSMLSLAGCNDPLDPHNYISGPNGGCYYNNEQGNKVYVDRSYC